MSAFTFTCPLCNTHHDEYPGRDKPPVWLLRERLWICHECDRGMSKPQANTPTGPVQVYMELYFEGEAA